MFVVVYTLQQLVRPRSSRHVGLGLLLIAAHTSRIAESDARDACGWGR